MNHVFSTEPCFKTILRSQSGALRQLLLLVLLVLVAGAGSFYYFSNQGQLPVGRGVATEQKTVLIKPLPARGNPLPAKNGEKAAAVKQQNASNASTETGAEKSAPAPAVKKSVAATSKAETGPASSTKKSVAKPASTATAHGKTKVKKTTAVAKKESDDQNTAQTAEKSAAKPRKGAYTLLLGEFVMGNSMRETKAKLKSAGMSPVITKGSKRTAPMNRLFVAEFDSYQAASLELRKIRQASPGAFILPANKKYDLYAGSYAVEKSAESERERLSKNGIEPSIRKVDTPVSTWKMTAGNFSTRQAAEQQRQRLAKLGIKASLLQMENR